MHCACSRYCMNTMVHLWLCETEFCPMTETKIMNQRFGELDGGWRDFLLRQSVYKRTTKGLCVCVCVCVCVCLNLNDGGRVCVLLRVSLYDYISECLPLIEWWHEGAAFKGNPGRCTLSRRVCVCVCV